MNFLDFPALALLATASDSVSAPCSCNRVPLEAWQSLPTSLDLDAFVAVGTLVGDAYQEATFAEYHPQGTRYHSATAPIAPRYFPYNRSQVTRCTQCQRCYLRYNEAGGYFTEIRTRALRAAWLVDAP